MSQECANPLLLAWIKEWYDKAREQNTKGVFTYKKAYDSMKACPIAFDHPSQAQELNGLGPKLCQRLTEKLREHCEENGEPMPPDPRKRGKRKSGDKDPSAPTEAPPAKKPRKTKPKPYVPALRSGPYAILLALSTVSENRNSGMNKRHLIELAQPHCDSSFSVPSEPSKSYTAWSSMKTLQGKDLVYVSGGAVKTYTLTDEGWDVAKRVISASGLDSSAISTTVTTEDRSTRQEPALPLLAGASNDQPASSYLGHAPSHAQQEEPNEGLPENMQERVVSKDAIQALSTRSNASTDFVEILSSSPEPPSNEPPHQRNLLDPKNLTSSNKTQYTEASNKVRATATEFQSNDKVPQRPPRPEAQHESNMTTEPLEVPPTLNTILVPPTQYTIELLLDNREVRSKSDRDYIQSGLLTQGIKPTTRTLPVGDALWCARLNDSSLLSSHGEEGNEIILDHIVERKRLDDLLGSIKDGRFTEQKFRLKKSGVENVVYLVEDFNLGSETQEHYHEHMCSAIASTMVVGGFFVKRTKCIDDTIAYLARMTRLLREQYAGKTLHIIPSSKLDTAVSLSSFKASLPELHFITYEAFTNISGKTDTLTLRDVFLKMLMCSRGITGEKALEIQKIWQTPAQLVEAMRNLDDRGKEELIWKKLGGHVGRKKVGKVVSKRIGEVWSGT